MILRTLCAFAAALTVCAGSVAVVAPAFAADGATAAADGADGTDNADGSGDGDTGDGDTGDDGDATTLADVTLRWGMNDETNSAAFYGGCNFLSAGVAADTGGSKTWDESLYTANDGNVSIQKPDANGEWTEATWASKCLTRDGANVTMGKRADGRSINTESQVVVSGGTGTVKSDGTTTVSWKGSWTVAYYGGMTYWSVTDPTLTLAADGTGALTATASGYGADMNDASKWLTLEPQEIHLADFTGGNAVDVAKALDDHGFTATPDYLGVAVNASGDHGSQAGKDAVNEAYWGAFPQSFVDFQMGTGQSAYWYTSGSARDFAKPTLPLYVQYDASYVVDAGEGSPGGGTGTGAGTGSGSGVATSGGAGAAKAGTGAGTAGTGTSADASSDSAGAGDADTADDGSTGADAGAAGVGDDVPLIADNAKTIAVGSGAVAVASALPLATGCLIRHRLGLDAAAELDRCDEGG
ncbi:hypothetical protein [Bifidobacterium stellenboschense]|nr:hypothetical protein [Bifidobacterium stellenboschense]